MRIPIADFVSELRAHGAFVLEPALPASGKEAEPPARSGGWAVSCVESIFRRQRRALSGTWMRVSSGDSPSMRRTMYLAEASVSRVEVGT